MDVSQIQNGLVGMALFDAWADSVAAMHGRKRVHGDPLIAAAFAAFEGYVNSVEAQNAALIAGVGAQLNIYGLNPQGNGVITQAQMAPLLALNLIA